MAGIALPVQLLVAGWKVRGSSCDRDNVSRPRPDQPRGPHSLVFTGYRFPFLGVKRLGRGTDHSPLLAQWSRILMPPLRVCFGSNWTVFLKYRVIRTSIFPELYMVCELST